MKLAVLLIACPMRRSVSDVFFVVVALYQLTSNNFDFFFFQSVVDELEAICELSVPKNDTNGFAQIPKIIESANVPILENNVLIK